MIARGVGWCSFINHQETRCALYLFFFRPLHSKGPWQRLVDRCNPCKRATEQESLLLAMMHVFANSLVWLADTVAAVAQLESRRQQSVPIIELSHRARTPLFFLFLRKKYIKYIASHRLPVTQIATASSSSSSSGHSLLHVVNCNFLLDHNR